MNGLPPPRGVAIAKQSQAVDYPATAVPDLEQPAPAVPMALTVMDVPSLALQNWKWNSCRTTRSILSNQVS